MKLKTITIEGKTYAETDSAGLPIYVFPDGQEKGYDGAAAATKITSLNGEAKKHREDKEAAELRLKAFEGIENPEDALKAIETVKNLDAGQLVTAGKVEEIKAAAKKAAEDQVAHATKQIGETLKTVTDERDSIRNEYHNEKIGSAFSRSKFIAEKLAIPVDVAQAVFGKNFKIDDGKIIAVDSKGNNIFSTARPGEAADFEEALESLVTAYPNKDSILKGRGGGTGAGPGNPGGGANGKTMARSEFDRLDATTKSAKMKEGFTLTEG